MERKESQIPISANNSTVEGLTDSTSSIFLKYHFIHATALFYNPSYFLSLRRYSWKSVGRASRVRISLLTFSTTISLQRLSALVGVLPVSTHHLSFPLFMSFSLLFPFPNLTHPSSLGSSPSSLKGFEWSWSAGSPLPPSSPLRIKLCLFLPVAPRFLTCRLGYSWQTVNICWLIGIYRYFLKTKSM